MPAKPLPTQRSCKGAGRATRGSRRAAGQPRGPALGGSHPGGVGRRAHARRCGRRPGHLRAAVLPVGATGLGGPGGGLRAAAGRARRPARSTRSRSWRRRSLRLKQECARQQALVRAAQRTIGLAPPPPRNRRPKAGGKAAGKAAGKKAAQAAAGRAGLEGRGSPAGRRRRRRSRAADSSAAASPEVLQRSAVTNPSPPAAPAPRRTAGRRIVHGGATA